MNEQVKETIIDEVVENAPVEEAVEAATTVAKSGGLEMLKKVGTRAVIGTCVALTGYGLYKGYKYIKGQLAKKAVPDEVVVEADEVTETEVEQVQEQVVEEVQEKPKRNKKDDK